MRLKIVYCIYAVKCSLNVIQLVWPHKKLEKLITFLVVYYSYTVNVYDIRTILGVNMLVIILLKAYIKQCPHSGNNGIKAEQPYYLTIYAFKGIAKRSSSKCYFHFQTHLQHDINPPPYF